MQHTVTVEYNDEMGYFITLPDAVLDAVDWKEGDKIEWKDNGDGSWTLTKVKNTQYVLVETVSTFSVRYVVEVPEGKEDWALDTVVMEKAKEFSQKHIGESIVSHRVVDEKEIITMCDAGNDYAREWSNSHKMKAFVTNYED